ncbi:MAG: hypothetical protein PF483_07950 [Halothiobacillus sp.]|jgi:hypothetical protein|nr:hypothetical protein [Halothiobacillus sp.]
MMVSNTEHQVQVGQVLPDIGVVSKIIKVVPVLHKGWDMDNYGWLVRLEDGRYVALTTDHGRIVLWSIEDMREKMAEAQESMMAIAQTIGVVA